MSGLLIPKRVIKLKLANYDQRPTQVPKEYISRHYLKCLLNIGEEPPRGINDPNIQKPHIFARKKPENEQIHWHQAHELYLDEPYADTGLKNLFNDPSLQLEKYKSEILMDYQAIPHFTDFTM